MLLDPTFVAEQEFAVTFSRVLIDGGSSINILYKDTADKLGITEARMNRSRTIFHDIVPGSPAHQSAPSGWTSSSETRKIFAEKASVSRW